MADFGSLAPEEMPATMAPGASDPYADLLRQMLFMQSGMQAAPPADPPRPGAHLYDAVRNMRSVGIGESVKNALFLPRDENGVPRAPGATDFVSAALMAIPGAKMPTGYGRFSLEVHRGGGTPSVSHQLREGKPLFAHTDKNIAAEYGKTESFHVDPESYLDARTPEGAKIWKEINRNEMKAGERGYEGVIYPDPHDWAAPVNGHEVAILDHSSVLLPGERAWVAAERAAGRDPFGSK